MAHLIFRMKSTANLNTLFPSLPEEIRGMIYNKLPQDDVIQLRLVSKKVKEEIDLHYLFKIKFYDSWPLKRQETIRNLRIKELEVIFLDNLIQIPTGSTFFGFPESIRSLTIITDVISPENFFLLMQECGKHLEQLSVCIVRTFSGRRREWDTAITFPDPTQNPFTKLRKLQLGIRGYLVSNTTSELNSTNDLFIHLTESASTSSHLNCIDITLSQPSSGTYKRAQIYSRAVFHLIATQVKTLETIEIAYLDNSMFKGPYTDKVPYDDAQFKCYSPLSQNTLTLLESVDYLKKIVIKWKGWLGLDWVQETWKNLLRFQKRLEVVQVSKMPLLETHMLRVIVGNNSKSLEHLSITWTKKTKARGRIVQNVIDMSMFQNSHNLTYLKLTEWKKSSVNEMVNFQFLPRRLEVLEIQNILIPTLDIKLWLYRDETNSSLRRLKYLKLYGVGINDHKSGEHYGVDGSTLKMVLDSPSKILSVHIKGFNWSTDKEFEKLNTVWERFSTRKYSAFTYLRSQLIVERESANVPFEKVN